jgi:hypothetical protein
MIRPLVAIAVATLVAPLLFGASYTTVTTVAGGPSSSTFAEPYGITVTPAGDLIVADRDHHQIKRVTPAGVVSVIAGSGEAGASDGPASSAQFKSPVAVAYDAPRNIIYVADLRPGLLPLPPLDPSDAVRKIAPDGTVSTLAAANLSNPYGITVDVDGNVYVSDSGHNCVKKITPSGTVTTVAGSGQSGSSDGAALQARFNQPNGLAVTTTGVLYIADQKNHLIRKLENGVVSTVAGTGSNGWVDGPALSAKFREPRGIAFDSEGSLIIADSNNSLIRRLTLGATPTVSTVAGNGNVGYADGPPPTAKFREPAGVAVYGAIFVADADNSAIRAIYPLPTITAVLPVRGPLLGGNGVSVSGSGFVVGQTQVKFGSASATAVAVNAETQLGATVPAASSGTVDVTVTTPGGTATLTNGYTYVPPPSIGAVQPPKGATAGGTPVTISGSGFAAGDTAVTFAAAPATAISVTAPTQINATTPAGASGLVDVTVTTTGGASSLHNGFRYIAPPSIASFAPSTGGAGTVVTITGQNFDPDPTGDIVTFGSLPANVSSATATQLVVVAPTGVTSGRITVTTAGGTIVSTTDFNTATVVALRISSPTTTLDAGSSVPFNAIAVFSDGSGVDATASASWSASGQITVTSAGLVAATAAGAGDVAATFNGFSATVHVTANAVTLPPDPSSIAPILSPTVVALLSDEVKFLYSGGSPIQTGVASRTIDDDRVTVIRGVVRHIDGAALAGATVRVLNHPEYGTTITRADGMYDIAFNGGGLLTLVFEKNGYIAAQRSMTTRWGQQRSADDVVLAGYDARVGPVAMNAAGTQVARAGSVSDVDGTRQATLIVAAGTAATIVMKDGSTQTPAVLSIRATELTVGPLGQKAMPAPLPPTSAYTYCVELSADEALSANVAQVLFSKPIAVYLENFLHFPAGTAIPVGSYDRNSGSWAGSQNAIVLTILSTSGGVAAIDTNGDGAADDAPTLAAAGIDSAELQQLASLYTPGQTVWRAVVSHFSPWDFNLPWDERSAYFAPGTAGHGGISWEAGPDAALPGQPAPETTKPVSGPCRASGSIIDCNNQSLGEEIPIAGTSLSLEYNSSRIAQANHYSMKIQVTGTAVPAKLAAVDLRIDIAGRTFFQSFPPTPSQSSMFVWDGQDAYGRTVQGTRDATVTLIYSYPVFYQASVGLRESWALASGLPLTIAARNLYPVPQVYTVTLGQLSVQNTGFAGWMLSAQQFFDGRGRIVYGGDGSSRGDDPQTKNSLALSNFAGNGLCCVISEGAPASASPIDFPQSMAVAGDGTLYLTNGASIQRVDTSGVITTIFGDDSQFGFTPDGVPLAGALLSGWDLTLSPDGILYFNDQGNNRVRAIIDGKFVTVAGNGQSPRYDGRSIRCDGDPLGADASLSRPTILRIRKGSLGTARTRAKLLAACSAFKRRRLTESELFGIESQ